MNDKVSDTNPIVKFVFIYIILALALFLPAGTIFWLQGWIYIVFMVIFSTSYMTYLKRNDPNLLKTRTESKATEPWDKKVTGIASICILAIFIVPGFDAVRFQWSTVPILINIIGFIGVGLSLILFFLVSRENTYLSRVVEIQKEREHKVITTGPYKIVRHPMYLAVIILFLSQCLALGSLFSLIPWVGLTVSIVIRTIHEDILLHEELEGYEEYTQKTKYKIIPGIW